MKGVHLDVLFELLLGLGSLTKLCESIFKLLNIIYSPSRKNNLKRPTAVLLFVYFRPPPEENIGFMNKYGILSRGSGNSYLQHSINSNLISAKTSTSGKFAILFNREMAILKFLFAIADFKCAIFGTWSSFYMMPLASSQSLFLVKVSLGTWDLLSDVVFSHWVGDCQKFFFSPRCELVWFSWSPST